MTTSTLPLPDVRPDVASGVFYAVSATHPDVPHTLGLADRPDGTLRVTCTCPAGQFARPDRRPIPCRHARAVVALLLDHGIVEAAAGRYHLAADPWVTLAAAGESTPTVPSVVERQVSAAFAAGRRQLAEQLAAAATTRSWASVELLVRSALTDAAVA